MKSLLGFHRTHDIRSNGTYQLPLGPGRFLFNNAPTWISRIVERWQLGGVSSWSSGQPLNLTLGTASAGAAVGTASFNQFVTGTPMIVGDFPKSTGSITKQPGECIILPA